MPAWQVPNFWQGETCWIIGGGHSVPRQFDVPENIIHSVMNNELPLSAYSPYLSQLHGQRIIGINNAYSMGEWIDIVFFGDCPWYTIHRSALATFPGLKVSCCPRFVNKKKENFVKGLKKNPDRRFGITQNKTKVSWNGNSGSAAINLAVHLGVKKIILLGFDMCPGEDGNTHFHSFHGKTKKATLARHLRGFPQIAKDAKELGIEIINASPDSAIKEFLKVSVKDLL